MSFHFFLSATNYLHLLTPSTWRSLSTSSFHLFLGLPLLLVPSSSWVKNDVALGKWYLPCVDIFLANFFRLLSPVLNGWFLQWRWGCSDVIYFTKFVAIVTLVVRTCELCSPCHIDCTVYADLAQWWNERSILRQQANRWRKLYYTFLSGRCPDHHS